MKGLILGFLCLGFFLLFGRIRWLDKTKQILKRTRETMEGAARQRSLANRQSLLQLKEEHPPFFRLEQQLNYTGLMVRFPFLSVEIWVAGNVIVCALVFLTVGFLGKSLLWGCAAAVGLLLFEGGVFQLLRAANRKRVGNNLMKFLDFLGNYSVTAGEVTNVFSQVGKYMEEPLRSALEGCCYEAQLTGDVNLALLSMAEKIEHPKFKELARNLEISIRYTADFTALVNNSRRNMREYLRSVQERKAMAREGFLNMLLLLGLSLFVLITVDRLIATSVRQILFHTPAGRIAIGTLLCIFLLFAGKMSKLQS